MPKQERSIKSKSSPKFSLITVAPVNKAKSSNISFLFTPWVGAGTIFTFIEPLFLFIANAAATFASTSPTISNGMLFFITCSSIVCICLILSTAESTSNILGLTSSAVFAAAFVTKWLLVKPFSYWTPSTTSILVSPSWDVSIITTPVKSTAL